MLTTRFFRRVRRSVSPGRASCRTAWSGTCPAMRQPRPFPISFPPVMRSIVVIYCFSRSRASGRPENISRIILSALPVSRDSPVRVSSSARSAYSGEGAPKRPLSKEKFSLPSCARITARSTTLRNSRIFPGQAWARSFRASAGSMPGTVRPRENSFR